MTKPKQIRYTNIFGEEVVVTPGKKQNPMIKACGPGPAEFRCKHCVHFIVKTYSKTYFKCAFRGDTNGPGTDHRANWPTCSRFVMNRDEAW